MAGQWQLLSDGSVEMPDGNIILRGIMIVIDKSGNFVSKQLPSLKDAPKPIVQYLQTMSVGSNVPYGIALNQQGGVDWDPGVWDTLWYNLSHAVVIPQSKTQAVVDAARQALNQDSEIFQEPKTTLQKVAVTGNPDVLSAFTETTTPGPVAQTQPQTPSPTPSPPPPTPTPAQTPLPTAEPAAATPAPQQSAPGQTPPTALTPAQSDIQAYLLGNAPGAGQGTTGPSPETAPGVQQIVDATNAQPPSGAGAAAYGIAQQIAGGGAAQPAIALTGPPGMEQGAEAPSGQGTDATSGYGRNVPINLANPTYNEYLGYVQQLQNAGGRNPMSYDQWRVQAYRTSLQTQLLNAYNQAYQDAYGVSLSTRPDLKNLVIGKINSMDNASLMRLGMTANASVMPLESPTQDELVMLMNTPTPSGGTYIDGQIYSALLNGPPNPQNYTQQIDDPKHPGQKLTVLSPNAYSNAVRDYDTALKAYQTAVGKAATDAGKMTGFIDTAFNNAAGLSTTGGGPAISDQQAALNARQQYIASSIRTTLGRDATQAEINTYANAPDQTFQDFLARAPYKYGMNLAEWSANEQTMNKAYLQYFGRIATDPEIGWAAGQSADAIQAHIMQAQSRVNGMNLGTYLNYSSQLDNISQELYGTQADDHIVAAFHQSLQSMGKDFTPSINPKGGS